MSWRRILLVPLAVAACSDDDGGATTTVGGSADAPAATAAPTATDALAAPTDAATSTVVTVTTAPPAAADPATTAPPVPTEPAGVVPQGFAAEQGVITAADGTICDVCLWSATSPEQRARGLMGVTDLGGADGMVFRWDAPYQGNFWMRDTPMPLSIAFFAADGSYISNADMVPCLGGPDSACARYFAAGPYVSAIEVPAGGLGALGIAEGSHLRLLDRPCDPAARRDGPGTTPAARTVATSP